MIPAWFYSFMDAYWPQVLIGGIAGGFIGMVWSSTTLAFRSRRTY